MSAGWGLCPRRGGAAIPPEYLGPKVSWVGVKVPQPAAVCEARNVHFGLCTRRAQRVHRACTEIAHASNAATIIAMVGRKPQNQISERQGRQPKA